MATTTGEPTPTGTPDPLDVLASEVGVDIEAEIQREGLLGKLKMGVGALASVPTRTRDKVAELVDTAIDRVYASPLAVPTAAEAIAQLDDLGDDASGRDTSRRIAGILAAAGPLLATLAKGGGLVAKVAGLGAKVLPTGRAVALGTTAVLAAIRIGASASIGVRELQVLASYLVERHRQAGLPVDRDLVEQVVVQAYIDPAGRVRVRPGTRHGFTALARSWSGRSLRVPPAKKRQQLNRKRVEAIDRLDLRKLTAEWAAAGGSAGLPAPPPLARPAPLPPPPAG